MVYIAATGGWRTLNDNQSIKHSYSDAFFLLLRSWRTEGWSTRPLTQGIPLMGIFGYSGSYSSRSYSCVSGSVSRFGHNNLVCITKVQSIELWRVGVT